MSTHGEPFFHVARATGSNLPVLLDTKSLSRSSPCEAVVALDLVTPVLHDSS